MNTNANQNASMQTPKACASRSLNMANLPACLPPEVAAEIAEHRALTAAREAFWKRWNEGKKAA
jgi:hypothetical protein